MFKRAGDKEAKKIFCQGFHMTPTPEKRKGRGLFSLFGPIIGDCK